jgi:hypothetical protein
MRYGILDDDGQVLRWVYLRPSSAYRFVMQKVPRQRRPKRAAPDLDQFGPAPF